MSPRTKFEGWLMVYFANPPSRLCDREGRYKNTQVAHLWQCWQAAQRLGEPLVPKPKGINPPRETNLY